jgi:hypothetical protein
VTSGATSLLARVVRAHGTALAAPVDVLLDPGVRRVLGFELVGRDGVRRFLPWVACDVDSDEIRVDSLLALLDTGQLRYYERHGLSLGRLRGRRLETHGRDLGRLADLVVDDAGCVVRVVVAKNGAQVEVAPSALDAVRS